MAETSKIEWTDSTFNPWIGCTKIAPACDHCYAADWARRYRPGQQLWGNVPRQRTSAATWREPLKWQRQAAEFFEQHGRRRRVFCASLADVFDNQVSVLWRDDLWTLIRDTPDLNWLLLTKRPQNIGAMLPLYWGEVRHHVWLGTTVEDQEHADRNIPHLLKHDAAVRFISVEPMLGPIDIAWSLSRNPLDVGGGFLERGHFAPSLQKLRRLDWVIAGGESGPLHAARPSHPDWFRYLRDQCAAAGVPFLFKQWGNWVFAPDGLDSAEAMRWADRQRHGLGTPSTGWGGGPPRVERYQQLPDGRLAFHTSKAKAGRLLDGVEHSAMPVPR